MRPTLQLKQPLSIRGIPDSRLAGSGCSPSSGHPAHVAIAPHGPYTFVCSVFSIDVRDFVSRGGLGVTVYRSGQPQPIASDMITVWNSAAPSCRTTLESATLPRCAKGDGDLATTTSLPVPGGFGPISLAQLSPRSGLMTTSSCGSGRGRSTSAPPGSSRRSACMCPRLPSAPGRHYRRSTDEIKFAVGTATSSATPEQPLTRSRDQPEAAAPFVPVHIPQPGRTRTIIDDLMGDRRPAEPNVDKEIRMSWSSETPREAM